ncbi:hypothetical protein GALL_505290 [mine drainage metagenome]|uniref:Uncharacterized protein n=1 Tax=mine drainage metagenome TaxID=410659 RepID=A0A1J5P9K4_9ZZZZ
MKPDPDPHRGPDEGGQQRHGQHPRQRQAAQPDDVRQGRHRQCGVQHRNGRKHIGDDVVAHGQGQQQSERAQQPVGGPGFEPEGGRFDAAHGWPQRIRQGLPKVQVQPGKHIGATQDVVDPGGRRQAGLGQLDLELVSPHQQRAPDQLVAHQNQEQHGSDGQQRGMVVAPLDGAGHVRTQARQLDVLVHDTDGFALRHKEPATAKRHHGVPDQAVRRGRQLDRAKTLPAGQSVGRCGLVHVGRNGHHGVVKAKRHVPHLAGKNGKDGGTLHAQQTARKQGHETGHRGRQKTQHRHRLQHIERGQNDRACSTVFGRRIAQGNGNKEGKPEGYPHAQQSASGVVRNL